MTRRWWDPAVLAAKRPALAVRAAAHQALARWFAQAGFEAVETPALQAAPGMEAHVAVFETRLLPPGHHGRAASGLPIHLHTSPEFAMKKLLAGGLERIWQLCPVFRNAEGSAFHSPEFRMLEWYRANATYTALMDDCENLLADVAEACGVTELRAGRRRADPSAPFRRLRVAEAFEMYCGHDLTATISENPADPPARPLRETAARLDIRHAPDDGFEDLFFRLMEARIEPVLGQGAPCLLYDYPISMAALARAKPEDPLWAERVELYVCGVELANGFGELTDAVEQRRRWQAEAALQERLYGTRMPVDEDFLAAVAAMPPAAGMALGFDRLVMLLTGADRIEDVQWAPVSIPRPEDVPGSA